MNLYLVRHAKAGDRRRWDGPGPDRDRPLSPKGRAQAEGLASLLAGRGIERVLSSPHARCVQTVEPLAAVLGLTVEEDDALEEGAHTAPAVDLLRSLGTRNSAVCSHGDVIPAVLERLAADDGLDLPDAYPVAKGSTWELSITGRRFDGARYLPPPS